jgi:hypothetical protein
MRLEEEREETVSYVLASLEMFLELLDIPVLMIADIEEISKPKRPPPMTAMAAIT